ncbi:cupin domain-containing protein [Actinomadura chibensis]|uniref:Cupin domain-containing protein n=1 Tax=Actinomadura chibensis TaxID=392828 RepID=A0A5D0NRM0_9ACTN|nr:cupin domain-containing protein [Actinomadura chibensis]TYB47047.1 cupin domain-containing protein [Actinomadura chibensis]
MLLTTLDGWRAQPGPRFALSEAGAVWAPDDEPGALAVADDVFADASGNGGQVVAVTLDPPPGAVPARGVIDRTAASRVRYLRRAPDGRHVALLDRPATAEALDLLPHPEGGWYRETWRSDVSFVPDGYPGERAAATAIYFLLPPGEESMWHAVRSAELWLWHRGGPLALLLGGDGDRPGAEPERVTLGPDVADGQVPQALVPPGHWQAARPAGPDEVLVSCVVAPGFDFADFRA